MLKLKKIDQYNMLSFSAHPNIEVGPWWPF